MAGNAPFSRAGLSFPWVTSWLFPLTGKLPREMAGKTSPLLLFAGMKPWPLAEKRGLPTSRPKPWLPEIITEAPFPAFMPAFPAFMPGFSIAREPESG